MRGVPSAVLAAVAATLGAVAVTVPASANVVANTRPTSFTGEGFDVYTAQPTSTMRAWLSSPMRAVNIYVGGVNRFDTKQPNLDARWVTTVTDNGWRLIPTYVGLQAPCTTSNKRYRITASKATAQGRANAADAISKMQALGLGPGNPVYVDMEPFDYSNTACDKAVSAFFDGWTYRLHVGGYLSGIYGHWNSTLRLLVAQYHSTTHKRPDDIWWARYDGADSTQSSMIPSTYWRHHRIHQYQNVTRTYNGIRVNIDSDAVDADAAGPAAPSTPPSGPPYDYQVSGTQGSTTGGLNVRSTPSTSGQLVRTVPEGGDLPIVCQTSGDAVNGDSVWDELDPSVGGGYVSDIYTTTPGELSWAGAVARCDDMPAGHLATPANGVTLEAGRAVTLQGWFTANPPVTSVTFSVSNGGSAWTPVGTDAHGGDGSYAVTWLPAWTNAPVRVRATVTNGVAAQPSNTRIGIRVVDTIAPRVTVAPLPIATLARAVRVTWAETDAGAGVASYDVRYQRASYTGGFGPWRTPSGWSRTTATAKSLSLARGHGYCFQVRARDRAGNLSRWTPRRCVTRALDDRALVAGAGWSRRTGRAFYADTYTQTSQAGRTLTLSGARLDRVGVVATTCAKCGAVAVYIRGHYLRTVSLLSSTAHRRVVLLLPRFSLRSGAVVLRTTRADRIVQIDGIVVTRT